MTTSFRHTSRHRQEASNRSNEYDDRYMHTYNSIALSTRQYKDLSLPFMAAAMKIYGVVLVFCFVWNGADAFVAPSSRTPFIREQTLRKISLLDDYMSDINDDNDSKKNTPNPIGGKKEIRAPENSPFSPFSSDIPAAPVNSDPQARLDRLSRLGGDSTSTPVPVQNAEAARHVERCFPARDRDEWP